MTPLNSRLRALFAPALAVLLLSACNSSNNNQPAPVASATLRIVHASPDAPAVDIKLNGNATFTNVDYGRATDRTVAQAGTLNVTIEGRLPGTSRPVVIGSADLTLAPNGAYAVFAVGNVAAIEPLVVSRETSAVASSNVRLQVVHAAPAAPAVAVYVTAPGADLATSTPVGNPAFKDVLLAATVPAGDYQIRVTPANTSSPVLFDSGTVTLAGGSDLVVAALQNTGPGASPITLLAIPPIGATLRLLD